MIPATDASRLLRVFILAERGLKLEVGAPDLRDRVDFERLQIGIGDLAIGFGLAHIVEAAKPGKQIPFDGQYRRVLGRRHLNRWGTMKV